MAATGILAAAAKGNGDSGEAKLVAVWLFILAGMVAVMVLLGGVTRLTGSGLSMVEWQPARFLPPVSQADWQAAFAGYRDSPQFRLMHPDMGLAGFKAIFWLEYLHRLWGRLIGLVVAVPLAMLWAKGMVGRRLAGRLLLLLALGGLQGLVGWLMVASGLADRPEVSHFRLAVHLVFGFLLCGALLWTALDVAGPPTAGWAPGSRRLALLLALVLVTVTWGAFTAGLKAGLVYETFPLMNGRLLPDDGLDPLHDLGAVQLVHRLLALSTVTGLAVAWCGRRKVPPVTRRPLTLAAAWAWGQAALGVTTLLMGVPVPLAAAHQMGGLTLFLLLVWALRGARVA